MSENSEDWILLQTLFHLAEVTPAEDRERVLRERCSDAAMVERALEIFRSYATLDETKPLVIPAAATARIGRYTLLRPLGSGGIGTVYLAESMIGGSVQRSALKMLAPHVTGQAFIERFHREQHILGSLDHVNITRLLDAGLTDSGQPYLVMEYVDGEHLDAYCDSRKLGIPERLQLFLHICDAVAYAHRNLVVHLDLKPSNILVSKDGVVKLLDFGTSKLIQADGLFTTTVMATPAYASPEQLRNEAVTTACDVYSLGTILFELLSGRRPYAEASIAAMIHDAMTERQPEKLSQAVSSEAASLRGLTDDKLRQTLQGDLAVITEKCLRPRATDRYVSVDALMQDVERYLDGRPVLARPQTTLYRFGKFARRNRRGFALAAIPAVLLIAMLTYAEMKQRRAIEEGRRAEQMQSFMYTLLRLANSGFNGKHDPTVADFLHLGAKVLPQYIHDPSDLRAAQLSMARSLGENDDLDDAQPLYAHADASAIASGDVNAQADAEVHLGEIAYIQGDSAKGADLTARALKLSRDSSVSPLVRANCDMYYAFYRDNLGFRSEENLQLLREAIDLERKTNQPPNELGLAIRFIADDYMDRGQPEKAEPYLFEAKNVYGNDPALLCGRAQVEDGLGYVIGKQGDLKKAIEELQQAYQDIRQCSGPTSRQTAYEATYLADLLLKAGRNQEALDLMEKTVPFERKIIPDNTDFSDSLRILGKAYLRAGDLPRAEAAVKEAIAIRNGKTAPTHPVFGSLYLLYGEILQAEHRDQEALLQAEAAQRILSAAAVDAPALRDLAAEANQLLKNLQTQPGAEAANLRSATAMQGIKAPR